MTIDPAGFDRGDSDHPINGIPADVIGRAIRDADYRQQLLSDPAAVNQSRVEEGLEPISGPAMKLLQGLDAQMVEQAMQVFDTVALSAK